MTRRLLEDVGFREAAINILDMAYESKRIDNKRGGYYSELIKPKTRFISHYNLLDLRSFYAEDIEEDKIYFSRVELERRLYPPLNHPYVNGPTLLFHASFQLLEIQLYNASFFASVEYPDIRRRIYNLGRRLVALLNHEPRGKPFYHLSNHIYSSRYFEDLLEVYEQEQAHEQHCWDFLRKGYFETPPLTDIFDLQRQLKETAANLQVTEQKEAHGVWVADLADKLHSGEYFYQMNFLGYFEYTY